MLQTRLNAIMSQKQMAWEETWTGSDCIDGSVWDSAAVTGDLNSVSMPGMHGEDSFEDTMAED